MVFCFPPGAPTWAVRICDCEDGEDTKSSRAGPVLRRSEKVVVGRRGECEAAVGSVGSVGSETAVANALLACANRQA